MSDKLAEIQRNEILNDVLKSIAEIPNPYPESIFTPLENRDEVLTKLNEWCKREGIDMSCLSADYARWQREVVFGQVRDCVAALRDDY